MSARSSAGCMTNHARYTLANSAAGDFILYQREVHKVASFGLLWTKLLRDDGVHVSVRYSCSTKPGLIQLRRFCCHDLTHRQKHVRSPLKVDSRVHNMQVPNEKLMQCDIDNVTESDPLLMRIAFDIDARGITLDTVRDLEHMVRDMMQGEAVQHLYDQSYEVTAVIKAVGNPLKYQVRSSSARNVCSSFTSWSARNRSRMRRSAARAHEAGMYVCVSHLRICVHADWLELPVGTQ